MNTTIKRTVTALIFAGALAGFGAGVANAEAPTTVPVAAQPAAATTDDAASISPEQASLGIHIANDTGSRWVLSSVSGDNSGVPSVGSVLQPGLGYQDFEVKFRAAKTTTDTASYTVFDLSGNQQGTMTVQMSVSAMDDPTTTATYTYPGGGDSDTMTVVDSTSKNPKIEEPDANASTLPAGSPEEQQILNQLLQPGSAATATFTPTSETSGVQRVELASYDNQGGGPSGNEQYQLSYNNGYTASTTDEWGATVTASADIAGVVNVGVSGTYDHTLSFQQSYGTTVGLPVDTGYTGYLYADYPSVTDTGTFTITLGNTTWTLPGVSYTSPTAAATMSHYDGYEVKDQTN